MIPKVDAIGVPHRSPSPSGGPILKLQWAMADNSSELSLLLKIDLSQKEASSLVGSASPHGLFQICKMLTLLPEGVADSVVQFTLASVQLDQAGARLHLSPHHD